MARLHGHGEGRQAVVVLGLVMVDFGDRFNATSYCTVILITPRLQFEWASLPVYGKANSQANSKT